MFLKVVNGTTDEIVISITFSAQNSFLFAYSVLPSKIMTAGCSIWLCEHWSKLFLLCKNSTDKNSETYSF
jgi:hypothetical protein